MGGLGLIVQLAGAARQFDPALVELRPGVPRDKLGQSRRVVVRPGKRRDLRG